MHDIRAIRETPERFEKAWSRRPGVDGKAAVAEILALDTEVRAAIVEKETAEAARNARSKLIGQAKAKGDRQAFDDLMLEIDISKAMIEVAAKREAEALSKRDDLLAGLPNLPLDDVPDGADEHANVEVRKFGAPRKFNFKPKDHADLGAQLGMMDFEAAARMSGARFVVLKGQLARLERALTAFMLDVQTGEHGYSETSPPLLVKNNAMYGTGQLPKFAEDLFFGADQGSRNLQLVSLLKEGDFDGFCRERSQSGAAAADALLDFLERQNTSEPWWLIPTAEVSLTNIVREQILDAAQLPMRMTAATPCFRSEAGSAGQDTKGMIRMHQFIKVELVSIVRPEDSGAELERMTGCAEDILKRLDLPFRTVMLCAGDMGFGARKTYDIEVWLPSQDTYREISSCSTCGDFQARRMDARFRREAQAKPEFVHTLNGSGLAVGRTLVAVLENFQEADGKVRVPQALVPYMGGIEVIEARPD